MALIEIMKDQNCCVSASQVTAYGIPRRKLTKTIVKGRLI